MLWLKLKKYLSLQLQFQQMVACKLLYDIWWGCSSVGRVLDWHAADANLIPQCGKGFFSQSPLLVQTLLQCPYTLRAMSCIYICVHDIDPVVPVTVWWIMRTLKRPACTVGWVTRLCCSWLSLWKARWISPARNPIGRIQLVGVLWLKHEHDLWLNLQCDMSAVLWRHHAKS